jgi:competence protein ComEA
VELPREHLAWYALAAVVVALVGFRVVGGRPPAAPVRVAQAADPGPGRSDRREAGQLVVHVAGAVRRPGVYRVGQGSRTGDAIEAAGGLRSRADPAGVNLAAPLADGQQVVVPLRMRGSPGGAPAGASASSPGAPAGTGPPISLSSATVEQLDTLDGIGPALAGRIVAYRQAHGGFRSIDELREVEGIGDKRLEALRQALQP